MNAPHPPRLRRLLSVLALLALLATACGTTSTAVVGASPGAVPGPAAPVTGAPDSARSQLEHTNPQFGASIEDFQQQGGPSSSQPVRSDYALIGWEDLIPEGASGEEVLAKFQERLDAVTPGTEEASALYKEVQDYFNPEAINPELEGEKVRLAGFVAPLTYDGDIVTEFLLVPNFGACIHVPPPPPNQTVMVTLDKETGLTLDESWGAVWVEGVVTIETSNTELAIASYTFSDATSDVYDF